MVNKHLQQPQQEARKSQILEEVDVLIMWMQWEIMLEEVRRIFPNTFHVPCRILSVSALVIWSDIIAFLNSDERWLDAIWIIVFHGLHLFWDTLYENKDIQIFFIKGFRPIAFIFIVISTTFWPICPPAFFRCLPNSGTFTELNFELRPLLKLRQLKI